MAQPSRPPIAVDATRETAATPDEEFSKECKLLADSFIAGRDWPLGEPLVTTSTEWGSIWRVDFEVEGHNYAPFVNRITCWKDEKGVLSISVALGQEIRPLREIRHEIR